MQLVTLVALKRQKKDHNKMDASHNLQAKYGNSKPRICEKQTPRWDYCSNTDVGQEKIFNATTQGEKWHPITTHLTVTYTIHPEI